jgi:energy-coupling factor transporter ATP-binding protein EcfA2
MDTKEFLDLVLPDEDEGYRALRIQTPYERQESATTNEEAATKARIAANQGGNVFFCLASMTNPPIKVEENGKLKTKFRSQANAHSLRCLFLDLDVCKPDEENEKKFATRADAVMALRDFCKLAGMPRPLLIASGMYGVHVYWPFEKSVPASKWKVLASRFKALCITAKLNIDTAVPADSARVLRVVGTWNFKNGREQGESNRVQPLVDYTPPKISFEDYELLIDAACEKLGVGNAPAPQLFEGGNAEANDAFEENTKREIDSMPISLDLITDKCAALADSASDHGARDSEPSWWINMGIASFCDKPEEAVVKLASGHADYNHETSVAKMIQWKNNTTGPATCEKIREARYSMHMEDVCETCQHRETIKSPVQLGRYVETITYPEPEPEELLEALQDNAAFQRTNVPEPYSRDRDNSIVFVVKKDGVITNKEEVCPFDLYPIRLMDCERLEERNVVWRCDLPHMVTKDIVIPQRAHYDAQKLAGELGARGITIAPKKAQLVQDFMVAYIKQLQKAAPARQMYNTLGWKDRDFVMPDGVMTATGFQPFPYPAPFKRDLPGLGEVVGSLDEWKTLLDFYNKPGYEAYRLTLLMLIGSPLLRFTNVEGLVVSLHGESGAGKSTVIELANSVYGNPSKMMLNGTKRGTTVNAMFRKISLYQNIHIGLDEVSNMDPETASDLVYSVSIGVGRDRLGRDGMTVSQQEKFCVILGATTNQGWRGKLSAYKADNTAEQMRLIEFKVKNAQKHSKVEADEMIRKMTINHGVAAKPIIEFLVQNQDVISTNVREIMKQLDTLKRISARERFWSAGIACGLAMGKVLRKMGLIDWDLNTLASFAAGYLDEARGDVSDSNLSATSTISELLEAFGPHTLVVNSDIGRGNMNMRPLKEPWGEMWARCEMDIRKVWLSRERIKKLCAEQAIDMHELQLELKASGVLLDPSAQKTLGAGTDFEKAKIRCWIIDLDHPALAGKPREALFTASNVETLRKSA